MSEIRFFKGMLLINAAVPALLLAWDAWWRDLGANPVNFALRSTGLLALVFLILTLAITPLARLTGWKTPIPLRRILGVYAFLYAAVHFAIFVVFDRDLSLASTASEIASRLYLTIGAAGLLAMLPLAVTSTNGMIRRLGPQRWKLLHRLAYVAAIAGVAHYILLVKADLEQPLVFAAVLAALLIYRLAAHYWQLRSFYHAAQRTGQGGDHPVTMAATSAVSTVGGSGATQNGTAAALLGREGHEQNTPATARGKNWMGQLTVTRIFQETPHVRTFRLAGNGGELPFDYLPGQFLTLSLNIDGRPVKRSYTIASSPTRGAYCELTVKREEQGLVSRYLHERIQPGDELTVTAPGGKFVFTGEEAPGIVLIAGGVGITPLMSKIRYLTDRAWPGEIHLIYAVRDESDVIFEEELAYLQKRHENLRVCVTLSQATSELWTGERGRVSLELLERKIPRYRDFPLHICGPGEMNKAVKQLLLDAGIPAEQIRQESFGAAKAKPATPHEPAEASMATAPATNNTAGGSPRGVTRHAALAGSMPNAAQAATTAPAALSAPMANLARIEFARSGKSVSVGPTTTILEAAEQIGVPLDYDCRSGVCGTCKVKLLRGQVRMANRDALEPSDVAANIILGCQAVCQGPVSIDA
ncbi:MAG: FAD-binding oxidoreductase [Pirellulales bacterium]|nr:FAD-binding oxidoreductase [Pirellulales bacterium]